MNWNQLADDTKIEKTKKALELNGFKVMVVDSGEQAKKEVLKLIPEGSEVFTLTSTTNNTISLNSELDESGKYDSVRNKLMVMDRNTQGSQMRKLGSAPEYAVASVHAVTEDGHILIASRSGSQLSADVYGAGHVIWVVSTKKIVRDIEMGMKRIYEHVLPQESIRVKAAYGMDSSSVDKLLIYNAEKTPDRVNIILVKKDLGF